MIRSDRSSAAAGEEFEFRSVLPRFCVRTAQSDRVRVVEVEGEILTAPKLAAALRDDDAVDAEDHLDVGLHAGQDEGTSAPRQAGLGRPGSDGRAHEGHVGQVEDHVLEISGLLEMAHDLERLSAPTLILHGADDRIVPVALARAVARGRHSVALTVLDDCGHLPHLEAPGRFLEAVWPHILAAGTRMAQPAERS